MIELIRPIDREKDIWLASHQGKEIIVTPTSELPNPDGWMILDDNWEEKEYIALQSLMSRKPD